MTLYRVEVEETRTWIIYIDAADQRTAEDEALELASGFEADDCEVEAYASSAANKTTIKDSAEVWVGGEEGQFITYGEYKMCQR